MKLRNYVYYAIMHVLLYYYVIMYLCNYVIMYVMNYVRIVKRRCFHQKTKTHK